MIKINVREFRKNLAKYLSLSVQVTRYGKTIARLTPTKNYTKNKQGESN